MAFPQDPNDPYSMVWPPPEWDVGPSLLTPPMLTPPVQAPAPPAAPPPMGANLGQIEGMVMPDDPALAPRPPNDSTNPVTGTGTFAGQLHPTPTPQNPYPEMEWDGRGPDPSPPAAAPAAPPDPRMAQVMTPPAVDPTYQQKLKDAQFSASFPEQRVNSAQYAMQKYGLSQDEAIAAAQNKPDQIKDPARRKLVQSAAFDLSFPDQRVNVAQQLMHQYGLTQDDALRIASQQSGTARVAQATAPTGTIGQIGKNVDPTASQPLPSVGREVPAFTPEDFAMLGIDPEAHLDAAMARHFGDAGAGDERTPQDPYADVSAAMEREWGGARGLAQGAGDAIGGAAGYLSDIHVPWAQQQGATPEGDDEVNADGSLAMPELYLGDPMDPNAPHKLAMQKLDNESDDDFAARVADEKLARESYARKQRLEEAKRQEADAHASLQDLRAARKMADAREAHIAAESQQIADTKIDPDRWWHSRSTGQQIATFLAAILGGFMSGSTGGRNSGLDNIENAIERDIAAQRSDIENRKGELSRQQTLVGAAYERSKDINQAEAVARDAAWRMVEAKINDEAANLHPEGARRITLELARRDARARADAARRADAEANAKQWLAGRQDERERAQAIWGHQHQERQDANESTRAGADYLNAKTNSRKADAEIEQQKRDNEPLPIEYWKAVYPDNPPPPHAMSRKDYDGFLARRGKGAEAAKTGAEAQMAIDAASASRSGPGGSQYALGDEEGNAYRQKDGSIFQVKDPEKNKRAVELDEFSKNARRLADLAKIMREKYGGASQALGSAEAQEYNAIAAAIDFETYKGFGLGAPSAGDTKMAANARGGKDVSSFVFDSTPGWEAYARNAEDKFNSYARTLGYTGPKIKRKVLEAAQAMERNEAQNIDVFDAPEIDAPNVDREIAQRAASRALDSVPALARQADTGVLSLMAKKNKERLDRDLITPAEELTARKVIRRAYRKRAQQHFAEALKAGGPAAIGDAARSGARPSFALTDEDIDRALGIVEQKAEE